MTLSDAPLGCRVYLDTNLYIYLFEGLEEYRRSMADLTAEIDRLEGRRGLNHAADEHSDVDGPCRRHLDDARRDSAPMFLTWSVRYEFLRVSTHPRAFR